MSRLSEALSDLADRELLDRVVKLEVRDLCTLVEMLPKVAITKQPKAMPGEMDQDTLFASS